MRWLGFDWGEHLYHASDYFEQLYEWAEHLIRAGKAYVDDQSQDEMRATRGTLTEPGKNSPFRDRGVEENLDLFRRMRAGEFPNGARVLRAKIDMASGNINLRDPVLYRILHASHPRTGDAWCIYPSYDFAHGQSDAIEGITHSICTLEFEDHRPLYDWFLDNLPVPSRPRQYEFARLNLTYTVLSKRVLTELVRGGHVTGWDDPRMPTLAGLRRRGVPPEAIRDFVKRIGVAKANSVGRRGHVRIFDPRVPEQDGAAAHGGAAAAEGRDRELSGGPRARSSRRSTIPRIRRPGTRSIRFGRELYVERDDFMENPPKKFFRLSPGKEVRLRYAYFITCREAVKNAAGEVVELRCTYDPATRGGNAPDGRKVKATLHWVSAADAVPAEVRLYNPLFTRPDPNAGEFRRRSQSQLARGAGRLPRSSRRSPPPSPASRCSSSGRAISAAIRTRRRAGRCSTAPSGCATPGRRCRAGRAVERSPAAAVAIGRSCSIRGCSCGARAAGCRAMARDAGGREAERGGHGRPGAAGGWRGPLGRPGFAAARAAAHPRNGSSPRSAPGRLVPWLAIAFGFGIVALFHRRARARAGGRRWPLATSSSPRRPRARRRPVAFPVASACRRGWPPALPPRRSRRAHHRPSGAALSGT